MTFYPFNMTFYPFNMTFYPFNMTYIFKVVLCYPSQKIHENLGKLVMNLGDRHYRKHPMC